MRGFERRSLRYWLPVGSAAVSAFYALRHQHSHSTVHLVLAVEYALLTIGVVVVLVRRRGKSLRPVAPERWVPLSLTAVAVVGGVQMAVGLLGSSDDLFDLGLNQFVAGSLGVGGFFVAKRIDISQRDVSWGGGGEVDGVAAAGPGEGEPPASR